MINSITEDELFMPHKRKWLMKLPKQQCGKFINLSILIPLHHLEPLEPKSVNGKN